MDAINNSPGIYAQLPDLREDSFRLVVLRSGQPDDFINCSLATCSMSDSPAYEALSYTWGDRCRGYPIRLNGHPFMLFENLGQALHRLRDTEQDRTFWIDAICINQENLEERSLQVQKMPQIYQGAKLVVIWLGIEADQSDQAVDDILALNVKEHVTETPFYREFTGNPLQTAEGTAADRAYPMRCLFQRGWFKRMWTLQEIVLARNVLFFCGSKSFSWECLENARDNYQTHVAYCCKQEWKKLHRDAVYLWYPIGEFVSLVSGLRQARSRRTLLDVLVLCRSRLAEDRRDKIYAIHGLYNPNSVKKINSDYTLPPREVYVQIARSLIEGGIGLELLSHVFRAHQTFELPSWVPDWSKADYNNPNSIFSAPDYNKHYNASGSAISEVEIKGDVLSVRAITIDTVIACAPMVRKPDGKGKLRPKGYNIFNDFLTWESLAGIRQTQTSPYFSVLDENCDAFWRTMIMDVWNDSQNWKQRRALPADYQAYLKWRPWFEERCRPGGDPDGSVYAAGIQDPDIYTFDLDILTRNSVRRFFRTSNGYIGMGPMEMEIGDHVMVLAGARKPFVMRPSIRKRPDNNSGQLFTSSSTEAWSPPKLEVGLEAISERSLKLDAEVDCVGSGTDFSLVGFSYLHGFMDGEATRNSTWRKIDIH